MLSLLEGLAILYKYTPDGYLGAGRDRVYVEGPPPDKMTEEERNTLERNEWFWRKDEGNWQIGV